MRGLALGLLAVAACGGAHHHAEPEVRDPRKLHVEINSGGSHSDAVHAGAAEGLSRVHFAVPVEERGEVELQVDVAQVDVVGNRTLCKVKVLVLRLPNHSMLGIVEGSARAGGTDDGAAEACVERLGATLVRGKTRTLLRRELRARR